MRLQFEIFRMVSTKTAFIGLCAIVIFIYFVWNGGQWSESEVIVKTNSLDDCIQRISRSMQESILNKGSVYYTTGSIEQARTFIPFVGNGYFGASLAGHQRLFLEQGNLLELPVAMDLLVDFQVFGFRSLEKVVLDFTDGTLHKFGCFRQSSMCVSLHYMAMAHRTIPNLLLQDVKISNPTSSTVRVQLVRRATPVSEGQQSDEVQLPSPDGGREQKFRLTTSAVGAGSRRVVLLSVGEPLLGDHVTVPAGGSRQLRLATFVRRSEQLQASAGARQLRDFHAASRGHLQRLLSPLPFVSAVAEHRAAWRRLWRRGFSIADSLAPEALNGDAINRTLYFLTSHRPMEGGSELLRSLNVSLPGRVASSQSHRYDRCFGGHDLFQFGQLWRSPLSGADLMALVDQWLLTLNKFGCSQLVESGACGLAQASLLAMGEFSFSGNHLEFNMHPSQLVRDMTFRSIAYGPTAEVNVSVEVDDSNKALLFVSVLGNKQFYACSAACAEPVPVKLGPNRVQLPLRITTPRTPLLYVSPDLRHIAQLRRAIHVREVRDAPAHEHHVIAMHRHGHPFGGLPSIFWAGLALLLLVFHLFLFKLVYSELCRGEPVIQPYAKYAYT